jgi:hypothetical protein
MTDEEQEARSMKWERGGSVMLRQLSTGNFALYPAGGIGSPFWIGPAPDIPAAYASRPAPKAVTLPTRPESKLSKLGLDIQI